MFEQYQYSPVHLQPRHQELLSLWQPALSAEAAQKLDMKRYLTASLVCPPPLLLPRLLGPIHSYLVLSPAKTCMQGAAGLH